MRDPVDEPVQIVDSPNSVELPLFQGRIEFENIWFEYGAGGTERENWDLPGLSFVVEPGEWVALVGATGASKISIISLVSDFYEPQRRRVLSTDSTSATTARATYGAQRSFCRELFLFAGSSSTTAA